MTSNDTLVALVFVIIMSIVGLIFGVYIGGSHMQREAVDRGYAQYNPTNAVWQWK